MLWQQVKVAYLCVEAIVRERPRQEPRTGTTPCPPRPDAQRGTARRTTGRQTGAEGMARMGAASLNYSRRTNETARRSQRG